jgi:hypothetical protein
MVPAFQRRKGILSQILPPFRDVIIAGWFILDFGCPGHRENKMDVGMHKLCSLVTSRANTARIVIQAGGALKVLGERQGKCIIAASLTTRKHQGMTYPVGFHRLYEARPDSLLAWDFIEAHKSKNSQHFLTLSGFLSYLLIQDISC